MPVIFDADSKDFRQWLQPRQTQWTHDLQSLLRPYEGDLEVYPVCKDVGKVGRSSPSFILPLSDKGSGPDIAQFFSSTSQNSEPRKSAGMGKHENEGNQDTSITNAKLSPVERAEANKKHKISDVSSPTSKRRQVKPGPPGVKKITDFFS